jgi:hypothetical protein
MGETQSIGSLIYKNLKLKKKKKKKKKSSDAQSTAFKQFAGPPAKVVCKVRPQGIRKACPQVLGLVPRPEPLHMLWSGSCLAKKIKIFSSNDRCL